MGSLSKIAEELLIHYTLHQYPYSDNEWVSIDQAFDQLKQDPRLAMHFIKQAGLIDDAGIWNPDLINFGLFAVVKYLEADSATGFCQNQTKTLISDRGFGLLNEFFSKQ